VDVRTDDFCWNESILVPSERCWPKERKAPNTPRRFFPRARDVGEIILSEGEGWLQAKVGCKKTRNVSYFLYQDRVIVIQ